MSAGWRPQRGGRQGAKALLLLAVRIEIAGVEPGFVGRFQRLPLVVDDREPGGVAVAALVDGSLAEHAFEAETEARRRLARRFVQRIAFPFVAAVAELLE